MFRPSLILICFVAASLVACTPQPHTHAQKLAGPFPDAPADKPTILHKPYPLNDTDTKLIKDAVARSLKDPNSALFGLVAGTKADDEQYVTVCGFVNAKNSFGGYIGQKPFLAALFPGKSAALIDIGDSETKPIAIADVCKQYGM